MFEKRRCIVCDKELIGRQLKYCSDCRVIIQRKQSVESANRRNREERIKKRSRKKVLSIADVNKIAAVFGVNYGVMSKIIDENDLGRLSVEDAVKEVKLLKKKCNSKSQGT